VITQDKIDCSLKGYIPIPVLKDSYLGNVLTTITDVKMPVDTNHDGTIDRYVADIRSSTDYSPFGAPLNGRTFNAGASLYGFNGQRKDDELYGAGNATTAEFWEYDWMILKYCSNPIQTLISES
jgi:hypothetical protein